MCDCMCASRSSGACPAARPHRYATCATSAAMRAETSRICGRAGYRLPCPRSDSLTRFARVHAALMNISGAWTAALTAVDRSCRSGFRYPKEVTTVDELGVRIGKIGFIRSKHGEAIDVRRATKLSLGRLDAVNLERIFDLATPAGELSNA
jgi:hypothetical protein